MRASELLSTIQHDATHPKNRLAATLPCGGAANGLKVLEE
jgi:hypothetical protein